MQRVLTAVQTQRLEEAKKDLRISKTGHLGEHPRHRQTLVCKVITWDLIKMQIWTHQACGGVGLSYCISSPFPEAAHAGALRLHGEPCWVN